MIMKGDAVQENDGIVSVVKDPSLVKPVDDNEENMQY